MSTKYETYIDTDKCSRCGGQCCKNCGCSFYVSDFENLNENLVNRLLDSNQVSIVAHLEINEDFVSPTLYLRARNVNRGAIDLLSIPTSCASLREDGCRFIAYKNRPSSGLTLIPREEDGKFNCYRLVDESLEMDKWRDYRELLSKIVYERTGMSVMENLAKDSLVFFKEYLSGTNNYSKDKLLMMKGLFEKLKIAYNKQYNIVEEELNSERKI